MANDEITPDEETAQNDVEAHMRVSETHTDDAEVRLSTGIHLGEAETQGEEVEGSSPPDTVSR
jgi:hypothetical protein